MTDTTENQTDHAAIDDSITLRQEVSGFGAIIRTQPFWVFVALIAATAPTLVISCHRSGILFIRRS